MSPDADNVEALEQAIMEEANKDVRRLLAEAAAKAERTERQAQTEAEAERDTILREAREEAASAKSHAAVAAQREAQGLRLRHREQLLERAFSMARQRVSSIAERDNYEQIAGDLVREAIHSLGVTEVIVRTDANTRTVLTDGLLDEIGGEMGVQLRAGPPLKRGTGVILETPDGHRRFDNTLETRLARMQDTLRTPVYRILMGERE